MSSFDSISENLRLQQIYSALVGYGAESVVDNSVLGAPRRRMQRWVYQLPEPIPELSRRDPDPDPARGPRARPT